jgi:hypothetical protein
MIQKRMMNKMMIPFVMVVSVSMLMYLMIVKVDFLVIRLCFDDYLPYDDDTENNRCQETEDRAIKLIKKGSK